MVCQPRSFTISGPSPRRVGPPPPACIRRPDAEGPTIAHVTAGCSAVASAPALGAGDRRFESCHPDQMVDVQTIDLTGLISRFNGSLSLDGEPLNVLVEEDGERLAWPGVDLVVGLDVELRRRAVRASKEPESHLHVWVVHVLTFVDYRRSRLGSSDAPVW